MTPKKETEFEKYLIESMTDLPRNPKVKNIVKELYLSPNLNLSNAFSEIFKFLASECTNTNDDELRVFGYKIVKIFYAFNFHFEQRYSIKKNSDPLLFKIKSVADCLRTKAETVPREDAQELIRDSDDNIFMISVINNSHNSISLNSLIFNLICSWNYLYDCPCSYDLLSHIAQKSKTRNDPELLALFTQLL